MDLKLTTFQIDVTHSIRTATVLYATEIQLQQNLMVDSDRIKTALHANRTVITRDACVS